MRGEVVRLVIQEVDGIGEELIAVRVLAGELKGVRGLRCGVLRVGAGIEVDEPAVGKPTVGTSVLVGTREAADEIAREAGASAPR